jgi:3-oxoacyl-[acyl-carrier-protein] synthase II
MAFCPIAVTGVGAITALGADVGELWTGLVRGQRGFRPIQGFDTRGCRVTFGAEVSMPGLWRRSRAARLARHAAREALAESALSGSDLERTGLVLGSTAASDQALESYLARLGRRGRERATDFTLLDYPKRGLVDAVARALHLGGPRSALNTACSSGLVAIITAVDWLRAGFCDAVVAGGVDPLTRYTLGGFSALRAVDPEPCRPFDRNRRGMTLGEGAGLLVLERLERAEQRGARALALVAGAGLACDAHHLTAPDPDGRGAARAMRAALAEAGIDPRDVDFINAHGTGTPHNDRAELRSVKDVFGDHASRCPLSTIKGNIGHCLGAAGAIEAVVAVESLRRGLVPPTAGLEDPEDASDFDFVRIDPRPVDARYGLTNSFGFGGNDASLILARPEMAA